MIVDAVAIVVGLDFVASGPSLGLVLVVRALIALASTRFHPLQRWLISWRFRSILGKRTTVSIEAEGMRFVNEIGTSIVLWSAMTSIRSNAVTTIFVRDRRMLGYIPREGVPIGTGSCRVHPVRRDRTIERDHMTKPTADAFVLGPGEGRAIDLGNFAMVVKASGDDTGAAFTLLEASEPAGFGPPMHIHHDAAEAFYVVDGEYLIFIEDREFVCPAGSFIYIPAGLRHGFRVGAVASRKLNLYTPAAMVGYFDELSAAIAAGDPNPAKLDEIALGYGLEVVGPVPEGYL